MIDQIKKRAEDQEVSEASRVGLLLSQMMDSRPSVLDKAKEQLSASPEPDEMADFLIGELGDFLRGEGLHAVMAYAEILIDKLREEES